MNFDDYCQQKAAPPGSGTYYALRQASAARQPLLAALFALRRELEETAKETSDPTVGRTKLAWWQKELAGLAAAGNGAGSSEGNSAQAHPVTQALAHHLDDVKATYPALQALLAGYAMDFDQARYLDFPNLRHYMDAVGGTFATLVARVSARDAGAAAQWAAPLGNALMLAQFVPEIGNDARHGRIYIPIDELQRYNVTAADLMNRRYSDEFTELMKFQTARAREALAAALDGIPAAERRGQRTLRSLAALSLALLEEVERERFQVLHQQIVLTPIRKLWIAWRAARRA
ncbi:MAG: squalene synthase HpnD [Paraburkholderia sp.]|uniref:squalene/phytoene synthase family protein n=1 Tax=Paraburkholderia sp. TaxID=1926495 RepID=UPI00120BE676|nr:squalene/phytoene synthase family protein [Paraburkholderia sp.]TAM00444.1 MAG: squalene synthase HpnD [Paraburkholderia sp.]TAM31158.1 MAG: squalene synthase HpnD [Paraburkholderia sp.]